MVKAKPLPPLEELQQLLDYDPETGVLRWKITSGAASKGAIAGWITKPAARNHSSYIRIEINGVGYRAHRIAYCLHNKIDPLQNYVDHIDGNGLNNKCTNLRIASHTENMWNRKVASNSASGFKGVSFHKKTGKWQAAISCNGKRKYLGLFLTPELAHMAYCKAAAELHGEFARGE